MVEHVTMVKVKGYPVLSVLRCLLEIVVGIWFDRRKVCRYIVCGRRHNACKGHFGHSGFCDGDTQCKTELAFGVDGVETLETPWRTCLELMLIERKSVRAEISVNENAALWPLIPVDNQPPRTTLELCNN